MNEFDLNSDPAKLPALPSLDGVQDPATKKFLQAVKEQIEIRNGQRPRTNKLDQALTFRDLYTYGLASFKINGQEVANNDPDGAVNLTVGQSSGGSAGSDTSGDLTIPGAPIGFVATGTKLSVLLEWDAAATTIAYTEVWRSQLNDLATAALIGSTPATIYADILNEAGVTYFYWIRFVNAGGIAGDFNDDLGTEATTGQIGSAEILSIDGAKIIDATILNAKISSVSADKITTGVLNATESISIGSSTSRIHISGSGRIRSGGATDFMNGSGFYFDNPSGLGRAFIGNGTYFIAWNGSQLTVEANNFSLSPNALVFNGSGTFSGALDAATGTFAGQLQAASGSFSGSLNAATGSFAGELLAGVLSLDKLVSERFMFTVPGTYIVTKPAGKDSFRLTLCGASGGAAGGITFTTSSTNGGGGGGGGGGARPTTVTFASIPDGTQITVVVGSKGLGGPKDTDGNDGQQSTAFSSTTTYLTTPGGKGGRKGATRFGGNGGLGGNGAQDGKKGGDGTSRNDNTFGIEQAVGGDGGLGGVDLAGRSGGKGGKGSSQATGGTETQAQREAQRGEDGADGFAILEFFNPNAVVLKTEYNTLLTALQRQGIQTV